MLNWAQIVHQLSISSLHLRTYTYVCPSLCYNFLHVITVRPKGCKRDTQKRIKSRAWGSFVSRIKYIYSRLLNNFSSFRQKFEKSKLLVYIFIFHHFENNNFYYFCPILAQGISFFFKLIQKNNHKPIQNNQKSIKPDLFIYFFGSFFFWKIDRFGSSFCSLHWNRTKSHACIEIQMFYITIYVLHLSPLTSLRIWMLGLWHGRIHLIHIGGIFPHLLSN